MKTTRTLPYKIARDKLQTPETVCSLQLPSGEYTASWREIFDALMKKAVPSDDVTIEDERHFLIRNENDVYKNFNIERDITEAEIEKAIRRLKRGKALGLDGFQNEIITALWKSKTLVVYNLLNNCLRSACFLRSWKTASLKFILKDKSKDRMKQGSYRPIALLPTMGKVYERIVVDRLQTSYKEANLESERQFEFRPGRSTEDAFE